mgnify:CR=1 FL=1
MFVNGRRVDSVADDAALAPGINAIGLTYDFARDQEHAPLMLATQASSGRTVNRLLHINATTTDLLYKLEAVRLLCRHMRLRPALPHPRRPQRHLAGDPSASTPMRAPTTTRASSPTCIKCTDADLTLGVAMTDAKGDRSKRPARAGRARQLCPHRRAAARRDRHPRRQGDRDGRALRPRPARHARPQHGGSGRRFRGLLRGAARRPGITIVARPAGRARRERRPFLRQNMASRPASSCSTTCSCRTSACSWPGSGAHAGFLAATYATHHRHSCIGARAGFGDLLIGAGVLMSEANGLDPEPAMATSATPWSS